MVAQRDFSRSTFEFCFEEESHPSFFNQHLSGDHFAELLLIEESRFNIRLRGV